MKVYKYISELLTLKSAYQKDGRNLTPQDLGLIKDATLVFDANKIIWAGKTSDLPKEYDCLEFENFRGFTITPELVDSHTHTVFGGNRAFEYSMRLDGADYQEIANAGGGILNTSEGTLALSENQLFNESVDKIERIYSYGVGTIEIKSGYALTFDGELLLSRVIHKLKEHFSPRVNIFNTYMAAHAIPKNYTSSANYIDKIVLPLLEKLKGENIIDAIDIFHEKNYFTENDTIRLFDKAKEYNIPTKIHADEFHDNRGASLAVKYNALSADHLLSAGPEGIDRLSNSQTVATLLPGTGLFLGKPQANGRGLLDKGAKVAIASDYNPGSCHCDNLLLIASIAAPIYKMNTTELWSSITLNAASALGKKKQGAIIEGLKPRFSIFKTPTLSEITYSWGRNFSINGQA